MEGSITKRKDGRWQGTIELPSFSDGKRKRKYVYAKTRQECRKKVNEIIEEIELNGVISPDKTSFNKFAAKWIETYCINLSPTTIDGYKRAIKYISEYIGELPISNILPLHIQEAINNFSKNHSEKTCRNVLGVVNNVFNYALCNKLIKYNPCELIKIKKDVNKYEYYIYSEEEFNKLISFVTGTIEEIPILLAGLCGLRVSEIMALTWNDIDFKNRIINIHNANVHVNGEVIAKTTKTRNSYREIKAPAYVIERLQIYKNVGYIYPKKDGTPENGGNYSKRFSRMLKNFGLPHTRFHDLRHFNATVMLKHGVSDKEASKRLGHADINMTKKYQHILKDMEDNTANILDNVIDMSVKRSVK